MDLWSNGVRKTWVVSKPSGNARDLSMRSRSLVVRRLSFARLQISATILLQCHAQDKDVPILEPNLDLPWRQPGDFL